MKKIWIVAVFASGFAWMNADRAQAADAAPADKVFEADKGPDTIDVSKYPKKQQENYKLFSEKCSKCHTLARPINSKLALPEEWNNYVTIMRKKPKSGISEEDAEHIAKFLIYDSTIRKKELLDKKLKEKAAAEAAGG